MDVCVAEFEGVGDDVGDEEGEGVLDNDVVMDIDCVVVWLGVGLQTRLAAVRNTPGYWPNVSQVMPPSVETRDPTETPWVPRGGARELLPDTKFQNTLGLAWITSV